MDKTKLGIYLRCAFNHEGWYNCQTNDNDITVEVEPFCYMTPNNNKDNTL